MDLMPSDEQRSIIASVRDLLSEQLPTARLRALAGTDLADLAVFWKQAADLGWFGLGLAEELGGAGYGLVDEALLFREIGRFATPGPLLATVLAARVAAVTGQTELAERLLSGQAEAALGVAAPGTTIGPTVSGHLELLDGWRAEVVLVTDEAGAALVRADALLDRELLGSIDDLSSRERARVDGAALAYVPAAQDPVHQHGQVLTTATLVGICEGVRDMATEHAKTRVQFGQPIGVHQAIKHRCADMAIVADAALNQLLFAALAAGEGRSDAAFQVAAGRVVAQHGAMTSSRHNVQVFGGTGFTVECDAHLYVKRTHVLGPTFGGLRGAQRALLAEPAAQ